MQRALDIRAVPPGSETVCLCAVDRGRLAVSFINSVYSSFGSGIVLPKAGFALQNRGCGFVTEPGHPNCIGPGKRPLHTIIPALVQKKVLIETGVAESIRRGLAHRGHDLAISPKPLGGAQAIVIDRARGVLCGGSDPRKDGLALGF